MTGAAPVRFPVVQIECHHEDCNGVVELTGGRHSVGGQPYRTDAACPVCATRWRVFFGDDGNVTLVVDVSNEDDE